MLTRTQDTKQPETGSLKQVNASIEFALVSEFSFQEEKNRKDFVKDSEKHQIAL